tara:strand:+ start:1433 stop:1756 length:324 start_codon:yes stop_codon:yes gene_type:complete
MSEKISASHILIMHKDSQSSRSKISKDEAFKEASKIYEELKLKPEKFRDIASTKSDCASSASAGSLGEFGRGVMVKDFENVAFDLNIDEISKPIETDFGFHIIKRDK